MKYSAQMSLSACRFHTHSDAAVAAAQGKMAEQLSVFVGSDRQAQSLENAKSGYKMSKDRLQALARLGYQLEKEVFAYKNEIVFPDDFGSAGAAGLRAEIFLEGQHCYQDTQKLVASFAELLGLHAKELELTAKISEGFAQKAFRGEQNLRPEDLLVLQKANSSPAKGSGKNSPSKGESKKNDSDITGTDKKKK